MDNAVKVGSIKEIICSKKIVLLEAKSLGTGHDKPIDILILDKLREREGDVPAM